MQYNCDFMYLPVAQQITLTSDLVEAGRNYSCAGEIVTYTCVSTSGEMFWTAPPFVPLQNQIGFLSINTPPLAMVPIPNIIATLTTTVPVLTAILQIQSAMSVDVSCEPGDPLLNVTIPLLHSSKLFEFLVH